MQFLRATRGKSIALFFFAKKKSGTKEKTTAYVCLLGSNVLPLLLRNSRFTLIPPKIYDIKPQPSARRRRGTCCSALTATKKGAPVQGELSALAD